MPINPLMTDGQAWDREQAMSGTPTQQVAEAIREHLGLDDFDGEQLYEGTIDPAELAKVAIDVMQLTEDYGRLPRDGGPRRVRLVSPWVEGSTEQ